MLFFMKRLASICRSGMIPFMLQRIFTKRKQAAELKFQREWVREFQNNKDLVREYWCRYRHLEEIISICDFKESSRILDVGCGISSVLHFIPGDRYGIDPLAEEYRNLYQYPEELHIQKADAERLPFAEGFFDVVFCSNVLDHITSPVESIKEIHRVLRRDGVFVLTVEVFQQEEKRDSAHPHSMLKRDVVQLLADRFTIVSEHESPWISLRSYVRGDHRHRNNELILITQKRS